MQPLEYVIRFWQNWLDHQRAFANPTEVVMVEDTIKHLNNLWSLVGEEDEKVERYNQGQKRIFCKVDESGGVEAND